jgi:hypothetical protein
MLVLRIVLLAHRLAPFFCPIFFQKPFLGLGSRGWFDHRRLSPDPFMPCLILAFGYRRHLWHGRGLPLAL